MNDLVLMFQEKFSIKNAKFIKSPLHICPLGAHVDHQHGMVTGMTLNISANMAYCLNDTGYVRVQSVDFPDEEYFHMDHVPDKLPGYWGNYLRGAVLSLTRKYKLKKGINGVVRGKFPIGGFSSSAAVTTAYIMALCDVNNLTLSMEELIEHSHWVERNYIGRQNGIVDHATSLLSKNKHIMLMDCKTRNYKLIRQPSHMPSFEVVIVYSGLSKSLIDTDYDNRIDECRVAAWLLQELEQNRKTTFDEARLGDIEEKTFAQYKEYIPGGFRKRAQHYFSEIIRVKNGIQAWADGDLSAFGRLVFESGRSSISNYECVSPELITIFNILEETPGVYGARFIGGGYEGCCIGLVDPNYKYKIKSKIDKEYPIRHPEHRGKYRVHFCTIDDGARIVSFNEITGGQRRFVI